MDAFKKRYQEVQELILQLLIERRNLDARLNALYQMRRELELELSRIVPDSDS